jgi:hypothetical protein
VEDKGLGKSVLLGGIHPSRRLAVGMGSAVRQKWSLNQEGLNALLAALGPDPDTAGRRYLEIHSNLARMFEWRGCPAPNEHADEAMTRAAKRIAEGEEIRDVATYCIGIGRVLVRELNRAPGSRVVSLDKAPELRVLPPDPQAETNRREECLTHCLSQLSATDRDLILRYYQGDKGDKIMHRKALADFFRVAPNVLRMRALRLRERLLLCIENCSARKKVTDIRNRAV